MQGWAQRYAKKCNSAQNGCEEDCGREAGRPWQQAMGLKRGQKYQQMSELSNKP